MVHMVPLINGTIFGKWCQAPQAPIY